MRSSNHMSVPAAGPRAMQDDASVPLSRLVGGAGLLVAVALLLAVPLVLALRSAARRRRLDRARTPDGAVVDAWAESGRRVREGA